jgi:agmatine deiminase
VGHLANVALIDIPTNDTWVRDHGPMFLVSNEQPKALVDWGYNAWGGKYPPFDLDDAVPARIASRFGWRRFDPRMVLEGGAVDGNGAGTVLTTRSCLLHPSRNPQLNPAEIERRLKAYTGATHIVWLFGGEFAGDDTDGHVDQLARFVDERTVVAASGEQADDEHDELLAQLHRELKAATDQAGRSLNVIHLPLPSPKYHDGQRLPASYCNFYITNGGVVVPQFGDKRDPQALDILGAVFPDRTIVGVDAFDLVWGLGAFHCMTQQEPLTDNRSPLRQ